MGIVAVVGWRRSGRGDHGGGRRCSSTAVSRQGLQWWRDGEPDRATMVAAGRRRCSSTAASGQGQPRWRDEGGAVGAHPRGLWRADRDGCGVGLQEALQERTRRRAASRLGVPGTGVAHRRSSVVHNRLGLKYNFSGRGIAVGRAISKHVIEQI